AARGASSRDDEHVTERGERGGNSSSTARQDTEALVRNLFGFRNSLRGGAAPLVEVDDARFRHTRDAAVAHHTTPPPVRIRVETDPRPGPDPDLLVQDGPANRRPAADGRAVSQDAVLDAGLGGDPAVEADDCPPQPPLGDRPVGEQV